MESGDISQKQAYLRNQIVDKGYDPQDFVDFLQQIRSDGADISLWTMEQLKKIVKEYINKQILQKNEMKNKSNEQKIISNEQMQKMIIQLIEQEKIQKQQQQVQLQKNKEKRNFQQKKVDKQEITLKKQMNSSIFEKRIYYEKYDISDKFLKKTINAIQFVKNLTKDISPQIIVQKPQIISTGGFYGIGATTKIWYTIKSNLYSTTVRRSDEDFEWLRNSLTKLFPGYFIPPLMRSKPPIQDKKTQQKRCTMINFFMNSIAKSKLLMNSKLIIKFISWTDYHNFTKFKSEINNTNCIKSLINTSSETGTVQIQISNDNKRNIKSLEKFIEVSYSVYDKLKTDTRNIMRLYDDLTRTFFKVGQQFGQLQQSYSCLVSQTPQFLCEQFNNTLITLNNIMMQWGKKVLNQKVIIQKNLSTFFKCCKQQTQSISQMLKRRNEQQEQYLKFKINLIKKKEKVYPDISKWQTPANILSQLKQPLKLKKQEAMTYILPKETDHELKLKQWLGYLNKNSEKQFKSLLPLIARRYEQTFKKLGSDLMGPAKTQCLIVQRLKNGLSQI